nr:AraC family transcriptional regulator [Caldimonas mangrovi]
MHIVEASLATALVFVARAAATSQHGAEGPSPRSLQHAQRFRALLDRSFREQRSVEFYARELGITPTQLNRVCREVLDTSALGALHARLMLEAKRDLAYTRLSVKEVALTLGFADAAYFTRFFTQRTGMSPSEFRAAARRQMKLGVVGTTSRRTRSTKG